MYKFIFLILAVATVRAETHPNFSVIETHDNIKVDMKYNTIENFTSEKVDGYFANKCFLLKDAAKKLESVASDLKKKGYGLYLFDCYRPQKGVDHFVRWSKSPVKPKAKKKYYPNLPKSKLFNLGYIAKRSGHSRGSTVDLSIYKLDESIITPVDMGTPFDFFSPLSHTANESIPADAIKNRLILKNAMEDHGFVNYRREWWHYSLKNEPNPKKYYNFDVK